MNDYTPADGPPRGPGPSKEIYGLMGQENIFRMMEDFYKELHQSSIKEMFSPDPIAAAHRSAAFFIQVMGGPPLYAEQYGPPRMRGRHMPFHIDKQGRDVWIKCFKKVLQDAPARYAFPQEHLPGFIQWLEEFSLWMINSQ